MAEYSDSRRLLKLTTPLGPDKLLVLGFTGEERLSGPFELDLDLLALKSTAVAPLSLVGKGATLAINADLAEFDREGKRVFHGVVTRFAETGRLTLRAAAGEAIDYLRYRATLTPWFTHLGLASDCRIFQEKSAPQILEQVFQGRGFNDFKLQLTGTHGPRTYCVQYRESDLAFVSRLMEEEGIAYFFNHQQGKHELVVTDSKGSHPACGPAAGVRYWPDTASGAAAVREWSERHEVTTAKYALNSYNFETPSTKLLATTNTVLNIGKNSALERYEFPALYATKGDGDSEAKLRLEAIEAGHQIIEGAGTCAWFTSGCTFKLTDHYRDNQNAEYLLTRVRHEARNTGYEEILGGEAGYYRNAFECIPKNVPYRPPLATPRPRIHGVQTAVVVGPSGEEIYTDKYARIKVQFHWDRVGKNNESSSCWVRLAQTAASNAWGTQFIPRIGNEVLVEFIDGDPDQPIVTGMLYNAQKMPPYALPGNMTQSGIKTHSTKSGGAEDFNELRFEDKKGGEDVYFHAQKDFHRVVENNDDLKIGSDKAADGSQTIMVWKNRTETVKEGNETVTIEKGNREVFVKKGNETLEVAEGNRTVKVIKGTDTHEVEGNRSVTVKTGNDTHKVAKGNRSVEITMGNDSLEIKQGNHTTKVALGKSETEAMQSIELKVGSSSIKIDQSGITLKGITVKVEGTGMAEVKAPSITVDGSAMTQVKGGAMVKIEGGVAQINGQGLTMVKSGGVVQVQGPLNMIG